MVIPVNLFCAGRVFSAGHQLKGSGQLARPLIGD